VIVIGDELVGDRHPRVRRAARLGVHCGEHLAGHLDAKCRDDLGIRGWSCTRMATAWRWREALVASPAPTRPTAAARCRRLPARVHGRADQLKSSTHRAAARSSAERRGGGVRAGLVRIASAGDHDRDAR
jgi:hypothetical protein